MLQAAKTSHWLIDPFDLACLEAFIPKTVELVLDSGAYKLWKQNEQVIDVRAYLQTVESFISKGFSFARIVAPDVFGDFERTWDNWQQVKDISYPWMPVWGWGDSRDRLLRYLDDAPVVGVGGLVPLMRMGSWGNAEEKEQAQAMLDQLEALCHEFPNRLHIFGINWLKAIERCKLAASGDTSKAWDGARYAHIIFQNTKTGKLQQCKSNLIPEYAHLYRPERCIESAKTLNLYCNKTMAVSDFTVRIYEAVIRVDFKQDPRIDEQGKKLIAMLEKAGFEQERLSTEWVRSRTDFWVEQCTKLAQKFGATVVGTPNTTDKAPNITDKTPSSTDKDLLGQMQQQMAAMQAELLKLRQEVEELKKEEGLGV